MERLLARALLAGRTPQRAFFALAVVLLFCCARERPSHYPSGSDLPPPSKPPPNTAAASPVYQESGRATYYASSLAGHKTANGERYDPRALTAAHRRLPLGTLVEVRRVDDGRSVVVRINDRGPYAHGAIIDLSYRAADAIGMIKSGFANVELRIVPPAPRGAESPSQEGR
jgi:rare lipoprotein A